MKERLFSCVESPQRSVVAFSIGAMLLGAALAACGGGGSSPAVSPTATPTPAPGAVMVTTSPSPFKLSVSGNGAPKSGTLAATQTAPTGVIAVTTSGSTACYDSAAPSAADLTQQTTVSQTNNGTLAQTAFTLNALNAGTCTITFVPASGTSVPVTVTVVP